MAAPEWASARFHLPIGGIDGDSDTDTGRTQPNQYGALYRRSAADTCARWKPAGYGGDTRRGRNERAARACPGSASGAASVYEDKTVHVITITKSELTLIPVNWLGLHRSYLNEGEMDVIAALLRSVCAESVVEFGCRDGRTAKVLLHNIPTLHRYVGVDVPMSYVPALDHQRSEMHPNPGALAFDDPRFDLIIHPRGSLDVKVGDFERVDACFIDGDHSEEAVMADSYKALCLVRNGGIIIWHDHFNGAVGVTNALNRLIKEKWPITHVKDTWLAYRYVEPDAF